MAHYCVLFFSLGDPHKLEAVENEVDQEIDVLIQERKAKELADKKGRSTRHKKGPIQGTASDNQLSAAFGERLKPNQQNASKVKIVKAAKAASVAAQNSAEVGVPHVLHQLVSILSDTEHANRLVFLGCY